LAYANDPLAKSTALVIWDGPDGSLDLDFTGLRNQAGGLDLTSLECPSGDWRLTFEQVYLDLSTRYCLHIYSDGDNYSRWCSDIVFGENYGSDGTMLMPFGISQWDFESAAGSGADFANVGAITLFVDGSLEPATDLILAPLTIGCPKPTAVELLAFDALPGKGPTGSSRIDLVWETATEVDNLGFYVYRSVKPELDKRQGASQPPTLERLNDSLIPSQVSPGSPVGATYTWSDRTAEAGISYYYWLEDVDIQGQTTLHGPVPAQGQ
jgi:hypothetical protein